MRRALMAWLVALAGLAPASALAQTTPGWSIGPEAYWYTYREVPSFVYQWGPFAGVDAAYTFKIDNFFIGVDGDVDVGYLDYKSNAPTAALPNGSGRLNGLWNYKGEFRTLIGGDLGHMGSFYISPYSGFGYRVLFEKGQGRTSTQGALDYDRLSQYLYMPFGIGMSFVAGSFILRPTVEYDLFLTGTQVSYLSQAGLFDVTNQQTEGYGARASFLMETGTSWGRIAFGPFFRWWDIHTSRPSVTPIGGGLALVAFEPHNQTIEAGMTLRFLF
jgi:hypothetical protein